MGSPPTLPGLTDSFLDNGDRTVTRSLPVVHEVALSLFVCKMFACPENFRHSYEFHIRATIWIEPTKLGRALSRSVPMFRLELARYLPASQP